MSIRTAVIPARNKEVKNPRTGEILPHDEWTAVFWNNAWRALLNAGLIQRCKAADEFMDWEDPPEDWDCFDEHDMPEPHAEPAAEKEEGEPEETLDFSRVGAGGPGTYDPATGGPVAKGTPMGNSAVDSDSDDSEDDETDSQDSDADEPKPKAKSPRYPTTPSGLHPDDSERIMEALEDLFEREAYIEGARGDLGAKQMKFVTGVTQRMTLLDAVAFADYADKTESQVDACLESDRVLSSIHAALENGR